LPLTVMETRIIIRPPWTLHFGSAAFTPTISSV
jgi:hypothetical protein